MSKFLLLYQKATNLNIQAIHVLKSVNKCKNSPPIYNLSQQDQGKEDPSLGLWVRSPYPKNNGMAHLPVLYSWGLSKETNKYNLFGKLLGVLYHSENYKKMLVITKF